MSRRRAVLGALAALCLAGAVVAVLAARDAGAWQRALRAGDLEAAAGGSEPAPSWRAHESAPFGLGRRLLGIDDDLAFRRAVALFRRARTGIPSHDTGVEGTSLRVQAEAALAQSIRTDRNDARRSAAANLLGVLAVLDAGAPSGDSTPIDRAILEFQDAVRLDPADEQAKTNLELLYQLTAPPNTPRGSVRRSGRSHSGASAISPGHGY
jgi:hypothetical protein